MKKVAINIKVILILLVVFSIIDIFDNSLIELLAVKHDELINLVLDTVFSFIELGLTFYALYLGQKAIVKAKEEEKQYRRLTDLFPEAIIIHRDSSIIYANQASAALIGAESPNELIGQNWEDLIQFHSSNPNPISLSNMKSRKDSIVNQSFKAKRLDGKIIDLEINTTKIEYKGSPAREVIARDVTCRNAQEHEVKELAYHDELTKLPNRRSFVNKLEQLWEDFNETNSNFAVMFLDLDGFKGVNDKLGHDAGDKLLIEVSNLLSSNVREDDFVSRLGGDEFTILLPNSNKQDCINVAERIIQAFQNPFLISNQEIQISPSIGIAQCPQNGADKTELLKQADSNMYEVKVSGKNSYRFAD
ncbi:diguanylate cyclase domain-containing protein [Psychrobacillus sp. NPDC058041]|uniref:diguanylate cyclase domain-containing protein n=1 Tax=Psychrobacillus sp. NPDC058041 TaxID=3346310 RepID=UPI0036DB38C6